MAGPHVSSSRNRTFDYVTLRLLVGLIAFAIPLVVSFLARPTALESISASYHTDAQDAFVGMLFIVAAFLAAYRGHEPKQGVVSKCSGVHATSIPTEGSVQRTYANALNGTGPGGPQAPRLRRGRSAAPRPVPLARPARAHRLPLPHGRRPPRSGGQAVPNI